MRRKIGKFYVYVWQMKKLAQADLGSAKASAVPAKVRLMANREVSWSLIFLTQSISCARS